MPSKNISDHFGNMVLSKRRILEECVLIPWALEIPNVSARGKDYPLKQLSPTGGPQAAGGP